MKDRGVILTGVCLLLLLAAVHRYDIQGTEDGERETGISQAAAQAGGKKGIMEEANLLAAGYDYDGAVSLLKKAPGYAESKEMQEAAAKYLARKEDCRPADVEKIPHIFYHSLIADTSRAFDGDSREGAYNQVMTTVSEFTKIMEQMYERGYVLVRLKDLAEEKTDGNGRTYMAVEEILLPEGKKPSVLSVDDLSYYHYMDGDGFASKIVLDGDGRPKCQYTAADGTVTVGDYDVVPLLDSFLREHPDGAYKGARGTIALTGYNGVLGYRTDTAYETGENLDEDQKKFLEANPDFNYENEVQNARAVAEGLKKDGWEFASHTWGHLRAYSCSYQQMVEDTRKWKTRVAPIVGDTDVIIFAFGEDIGDWHPYTQENEKYRFLKSQGYRYFCNVDSNTSWVQITDEYLRQGRRNVDGYRMYYDMTEGTNKLSDLFQVEEVFDPARPVPVPPMGE